MILLDIINNFDNDFISGSYIIIKFINNYDNDLSSFNNDIINNPIKKSEIYEIKVKIVSYLGSGSYGKVYKIKINKKYYALKISENEIPEKFKQRYESIINFNKIKKYVINIYIAGNIDCDKYQYFSIMEYGGASLKSKIPFDSSDKLIFVLKQLHNIIYLCCKHKIILTDFKLNNVVINNENKLKLIDLYLDCKSYSPCKQCKIVKTYSTLEIDKMKGILDDDDYNHTYPLLPLGIGLIDLLCVKSASTIFSNLGIKYKVFLPIKGMIPLIQIACYNYSNKSNDDIKEYIHVYNFKKKLEQKYNFLKENHFYENFMKSIEIRDKYKNILTVKKLHLILHYLFSADPSHRTLTPFKEILS